MSELRSLLVCLLGAGAICTAVEASNAAEPPAARIDAGVLHARSGLVWARCVEGMHWDGRFCTGKPALLTLAQALAHARQRSAADGLAWRLPRVKELQLLVDKAARPPGPDASLFPEAPRELHWSASAKLDQSGGNPYNYGMVMREQGGKGASARGAPAGWAVHLGSGEAHGDVARNSRLLVRLVRLAD